MSLLVRLVGLVSCTPAAVVGWDEKMCWMLENVRVSAFLVSCMHARTWFRSSVTTAVTLSFARSTNTWYRTVRVTTTLCMYCTQHHLSQSINTVNNIQQHTQSIN